MAKVCIPSVLREMTSGTASVDVEGRTLGEVVTRLCERYPGLTNRLLDGERLAAWLSVVVDGELSPRGLHTAVAPDAEIHFLPAISRG